MIRKNTSQFCDPYGTRGVSCCTILQRHNKLGERLELSKAIHRVPGDPHIHITCPKQNECLNNSRKLSKNSKKQF